ncbi:MAG: 4-hydroxy-tetrahydrodipicolinate synthase [Candidatus Cryptobacteroides sp.]|nr:4-hydroxy-tetrahydrodipicolinate synthase [Bacteroides sp.]MCI7662734.1 4-hydroxy-tetrahydrodipicolinate synthase [Bacteroides sp.]MDY5302787.1 4-hydroxy-tetrahydrodipicolinate synthase [Candidatus Cryptobacteroides sp.]
MVDFKGLATALVTPFVDGEVDWQAFRNLVRRQVEAGVDFLVPLGSTAETPCLTDAEKVEILEIAREESNGLPIVAGAGSNSLTATVRNMRLLDGHGADAYLIVVPFYNKPTQEGLYQYFKAVAEETDRQVILYNVPGRTGTNMKTETTLRLAEIPNITAVKEASGNLAQIIDIKRQAPEGFAVLSGNDDQTLPLMACGADGVISVASNVAPEQMKALTRAVAASDLKEAIRLNNSLMPLYHACFVESNPIPAKAALSLMGLCRDEMRLPLLPATGGTRTLLADVLRKLQLL